MPISPTIGSPKTSAMLDWLDSQIEVVKNWRESLLADAFASVAHLEALDKHLLWLVGESDRLKATEGEARNRDQHAAHPLCWQARRPAAQNPQRQRSAAIYWLADAASPRQRFEQ